MRVSCQWLKEYVDFPWTPEELAAKMTMAGFEAEEVIHLDAGLERVVVGLLQEVTPHPEADHLSVCRVEVGEGKILKIVCGAPNVVRGARVAVALPGARLPNGMEIETVSIRGVTSEGMLCSLDELGLARERAQGILILEEGPAHPGTPLAQVLGLDDVVIDFSVTPNRPDCLSMLGIAREVAALAGLPLRLPNLAFPETGPQPVEALTRVRVEDPELCPRYLARVISEIKNGPSPAWMQARLRAAGMRPINLIVDITNYVMLEYGQPLHAFDYHRLAGREIVVRRARPGETFITLDEVERPLTPEMLMIADAERSTCIAGIMGGVNVEVTEQTQTILLEAATFKRENIRRTSRTLGLRTEASARFEKGLDPNLAALASARATGLLVALAGGKAAPGVIDLYPHPVQPWSVPLRLDRAQKLLGLSLPPARVEEILGRLGFELTPVDGEKKAWTVTVPTWRADVTYEADLLEEIARLEGYERIPVTLPTGAARGRSHPLQAREEQIRTVLTGLGLNEAISYSFIAARDLRRLRLPEGGLLTRPLTLRNPLSEEQGVMRTTLLPGLLAALTHNVSQQVEDVALFEIGRVFHPRALPLTQLPQERRVLGLALRGRLVPPCWENPELKASFFVLKGILATLLAELGVGPEEWQVVPVNEKGENSAGEVTKLGVKDRENGIERNTPDADPEREQQIVWQAARELAAAFHPGRSAFLLVRDRCGGVFGELHPQVSEAYDLPGRTYLAELDLATCAFGPQPVPRFTPLPRYPAVNRDLALLVPVTTPAAALTEVIRAASPLIRHVKVFDVYQGAQVPTGHRSLAFSLTYQASDHTLTEAEVNEIEAKILAALEKQGIKRRE